MGNELSLVCHFYRKKIHRTRGARNSSRFLSSTSATPSLLTSAASTGATGCSLLGTGTFTPRNLGCSGTLAIAVHAIRPRIRTDTTWERMVQRYGGMTRYQQVSH